RAALRPPPNSTLLPYTTLFRSMCPEAKVGDGLLDFVVVDDVKKLKVPPAFVKLMKGKILREKFTFFERCEHIEIEPDPPQTIQIDRKSTRLNSSHVSISYAVFC